MMEEGGKCSTSPTHTTMLISDKENMIALIKQLGEALVKAHHIIHCRREANSLEYEAIPIYTPQDRGLDDC